MRNTCNRHIALMLVLLTAVSACRRDLWVYTDEFRQVELYTDWTACDEVPGGMTWWFMNDDLSGQNRHETTAEVYHTWLNLPRGQFTGLVFDYSPAEYSHVEFTGMTRPDSALVHLRASADQPKADDVLFGTEAVPASMEGIPQTAGGQYIVAAEPEMLDVDTLKNVVVKTGTDGDLILWTERDNYQSTLTTQTLYADPKPIVWKLRVVVHIRGINYMYGVRGSVVGLADGMWLTPLRHTSTPCLQLLDTWQAFNAQDSVGYITTAVNTFGLPDEEMPPSPMAQRADQAVRGAAATRADDVDAETDHPDWDKHLRLNLEFTLRDRKTVMNYHFDIADDDITVMEDQLVVRVEIPIEWGVDLPYVDADDSTGFDATVSPWEDGGSADTTM